MSCTNNGWEWIDHVLLDRNGRVLYVNEPIECMGRADHDEVVRRMVENAKRKWMARGGYGGFGSDGGSCASFGLYKAKPEKLEITAVEFLKARQEMCDSVSDCIYCPLYDPDYSCPVFIASFPEKTVKIVQKWIEDKANKKTTKTMLQDFLDKHPKSILKTDGTPPVCPAILGYVNTRDCDKDCRACWNRSMMTPERKEEFDKSVKRSVGRLLGKPEEQCKKESENSCGNIFRWIMKHKDFVREMVAGPGGGGKYSGGGGAGGGKG